MATKLNQIASGGAFVASTDRGVVVRNGTTDLQVEFGDAAEHAASDFALAASLGALAELNTVDLTTLVTGILPAANSFSSGALTDAATISWNLATEQMTSVTLGGNRTLANPTNMVAGQAYRVIVKQDGTGSRTLGFGTAYKWPGGIPPVLSSAANAIDILSFISDGTNMYGVAQTGFA